MIIAYERFAVGGNGSDSPIPAYDPAEIAGLAEVNGVDQIVQLNIVARRLTPNAETAKQVRGLVALNASGVPLKAALPCPPYGGSGEDADFSIAATDAYILAIVNS